MDLRTTWFSFEFGIPWLTLCDVLISNWYGFNFHISLLHFSSSVPGRALLEIGKYSHDEDDINYDVDEPLSSWLLNKILFIETNIEWWKKYNEDYKSF